MSRIYRRWKCDNPERGGKLTRVQIRLPPAETAQVRRVAAQCGVSVNQLIAACTIHAISEIDAGRLTLDMVPARARVTRPAKIPDQKK